MKLHQTLLLKFEKADWANNPEFGLMDTILEQNPKLFDLLEADIVNGMKHSEFGRKDTPSIEQIVRAAIYKELKGLNYRELEYHQGDSRICSQFLKIDELRPYSFQMYQKYISRIQEESLQKLLMELNKTAITEGLEDLKRLRQDSTVVETNIHWPTNNPLVWDCIRESHRLLEKLDGEVKGATYRNYTKGAKRTYFKINNTRSGDKRADLFRKQLATFTKGINQLTEKKEIKGEKVPNDEKLFSIYELHTDIIVKGGRKVQFGHKVNLSTGKSNLVMSCEIPKGNPGDTNLYQPAINKIMDNYQTVPRDSATDGGYASKANAEYAEEKGIVNIVFNKVVGSMRNKVKSQNIETRLKKWRSGIEANISNLKRGFSLFRCNWKGWGRFRAKILWSVIGYNIRVMTVALMKKTVPIREAAA